MEDEAKKVYISFETESRDSFYSEYEKKNISFHNKDEYIFKLIDLIF